MDSVKAFYKQAEVKIVNFLFALFWAYNYLFVLVEEKLKPYGFKKFFITKNQLVEPNLETWNCVTMVNMNLDTPKLIEQYQCGTNDDFDASVQNTQTEFGETLFIRKCDTYRLSVIKFAGLNKERFAEIPNANNTRFLNIMYFHKAMKDPIKINLDTSYIRNGNEVLSKTFVYRMLSYQYNPSDYVFDDTYELQLMDDQIKRHVLNSSQYIFFNDRLKNGYEVRIGATLADILRTKEIIESFQLEPTTDSNVDSNVDSKN
jgi:hypothetical protein